MGVDLEQVEGVQCASACCLILLFPGMCVTLMHTKEKQHAMYICLLWLLTMPTFPFSSCMQLHYSSSMAYIHGHHPAPSCLYGLAPMPCPSFLPAPSHGSICLPTA